MDASYLVIGVVLIAVVAIAIRRIAGGDRAEAVEINPYVGKPLLTEHEFAFFEKLTLAAERIGAEAVFPQVAMAALVDVRWGLEASERRSARNRFDRKIVDFVLVDRTMKVMMIVELDDRSHDTDRVRASDAARDSVTSRAGYRTARLRSGRKATVAEIEKQLRDAMTS